MTVAKEQELDKIVLAGDEVIVAVFREQLPPHLSEKIVDVLRIDMKTPENEALAQLSKPCVKTTQRTMSKR